MVREPSEAADRACLMMLLRKASSSGTSCSAVSELPASHTRNTTIVQELQFYTTKRLDSGREEKLFRKGQLVRLSVPAKLPLL